MRFFTSAFIGMIAMLASFTTAASKDDCGISASDVTGASALLNRLQYSHDVEGVKKAAILLIQRFGFSDVRSKSAVQARVSMGISGLMNGNIDCDITAAQINDTNELLAKLQLDRTAKGVKQATKQIVAKYHINSSDSRAIIEKRVLVAITNTMHDNNDNIKAATVLTDLILSKEQYQCINSE
ncbi:hypothetical protein COEREDRAFT_6684 [Coemansia reversa NRRL 1564]|uniref:Uncharacterized protein n=1 Tax=Coemansia reversa (strain ATCC 12441 / NRRL 1564) TaxID=763665 RepID=A0A2G5BHK1_COERN|nr:hypothetical protein COEREDRAFT_6684 [Coemansia reversa NRRL 1564]|eukprot:PIA18452.1 hypothetical protein COEREDRAFT_6684 [Coemansia reversa NRRL 1564]